MLCLCFEICDTVFTTSYAGENASRTRTAEGPPPFRKVHVHVAFSFDTIPVIFKFWEGDGIVVQVSSDMCDGPSEVCKSCMAVAGSRQIAYIPYGIFFSLVLL